MNWNQVWTSDNLARLMVGNLPSGDPGGLVLTLIIGILAIFGSTVLGTILGMMRVSRYSIFRTLAMFYVQTLRNVPVLIWVFWAYLLPPYFGFRLSKFLSVLVALTLFTAAYIAEIIRGGILSVLPGHIEAARALGLTPFQIKIWIVLPQAFFNMIPAITGRYVTIIKNTSIAFLIGLSDLTEIGKQINIRLLSAPIEVYLTLLMIYFVVNRGISALTRRLEKQSRFNHLFIKV